MKMYLYSLYSALKEEKATRRLLRGKEFEKNRIEAEIVRNVHSIEKGLSIQAPRLGFGMAKIREMYSLTQRYREITDEASVLYFVVDAVKEYLAFHEKANFETPEMAEVRQKNQDLEQQIGEHEGKYGGTMEICRQDMTVDCAEVEKLFHTRHSVRRFSGEPVPEELLRRAIEMAQRAPSACNRQAVRVYSVSAEDYVKTVGNMDGIGGFARDADRFLVITGVRSAYRRGEKNQFAVSASMFAAYLTLSLQALGIGACTVQHALVPTQGFENLRKAYAIPQDEQAVVTLAIGMMGEQVTVPVSRRHALDKIYRRLD